MNIVRENSQCVSSFAEWSKNKLSKAELEALMKLDSIRFNIIRQQQLERMTIDNAYEGDIESNSENETSEKHNSLRTRYKRRHSRFRHSKTS